MPNILEEIEAFMDAFDMEPSRFGLEALGDKSLVSGIKKGRQPRRKTMRKIRDFMAARTAAKSAEDTSTNGGTNQRQDPAPETRG